MNEKPPVSPNNTPSVHPVPGEPADVWEQINKYGTYECQDTTDTDNVFPLIGPGGAGKSGVSLPAIPPEKRRDPTTE